MSSTFEPEASDDFEIQRDSATGGFEECLIANRSEVGCAFTVCIWSIPHHLDNAMIRLIIEHEYDGNDVSEDVVYAERPDDDLIAVELIGETYADVSRWHSSARNDAWSHSLVPPNSINKPIRGWTGPNPDRKGLIGERSDERDASSSRSSKSD